MQKAKWRYLVSIFTTGLLNNNGYVVVIAGADALGKHFN